MPHPTSQPALPADWNIDRPRYRPDIEGLRAIAVLLVIAFHAKIPGFEGGFVGVDVFFVLSGYLITWLLVDEAARTGTVRLRRFYARRARRLLPALALVLLVTMAVTAVLYAPFEQRMLARTWVATALYASNLHFASQALDYHGASAETNPLLHTWSLSVEEQFYFVWPLLVMLGLGVMRWQRGRSTPGPNRLLVWMSAATALSFVGSLYVTFVDGGSAFYLSPARAWEFGLGGIAVLLPGGARSRSAPLTPAGARLNALLGWAGLALLAVSVVLLDASTPFPGVAALLPVAATLLLLHAGASETQGRVVRWLSTSPMQSIGKLSYSWYLWHWPALVFAAALVEPTPYSVRMVAIGVSLGLAMLSYHLVETPLRHSPALATPRRGLALALCVSALVTVMAGTWWWQSQKWNVSENQARFTLVASSSHKLYSRDECDTFLSSSKVVPCEFGLIKSKRRVVLLGDSHAGQFVTPLEKASLSQGWSLFVITKSGCPMVEVPALYNVVADRDFVECVDWRNKVYEEIKKINPEIIFVGSSSQYEVGIDDWSRGTKVVLEKLRGLSSKVVMLVDPPAAGINVPQCLARNAWRPSKLRLRCELQASFIDVNRAETQLRVALQISGIQILDLRDEVCGDRGQGCEAMAGNRIRYKDDDHLSVEYAETFHETFAELLRTTMPSRTF